MTPNPTKEEIDALERELEKSRKRRGVSLGTAPQVEAKRAVNPERVYTR